MEELQGTYLSSGIKDLDGLFRQTRKQRGTVQSGIWAPVNGTIQIALSGPAGTGKSVLGLHYAAAFKRNNKDGIVLYISTDLSHPVAEQQFRAFGLDEGELQLKPTRWDELQSTEFTQACIHKNDKAIFFVDLQKSASGDDWGCLERFFADSLPYIESQLKHVTADQIGKKQILIVLDAVEGLDSRIGDQAFGPIRHRRRQRLAQLLESTADFAHVVFTLETLGRNEQADEEFVADVAIRLDRRDHREGKMLTLEITKARGMFSYTGIHQLEIRDGSGTTSDEVGNVDDLPTDNYYVQLTPSLSTVQKRYEEFRVNEPEETQFETLYADLQPPDFGEPTPNISFGVEHLDDMLHRNGGLPGGKVAAIIGDENTHKSKLARSFLSQGLTSAFPTLVSEDLDEIFYDQTQHGVIVLFRGGRSLDYNRFLESIPEFLCGSWSKLTEDEKYLLKIDAVRLRNHLPRRVFYRRLPLRSLSAEELYNIVSINIREAICSQIQLDFTDSPATILAEFLHQFRENFPNFQYEGAWKVRVVFDDLNVILSSYGLREDEGVILPKLIDLCRMTRVSGLFVDSQPGGPLDITHSDKVGSLRSQVDHVIYTWNVPYGSGSKVAITAIPPVSGGQRVIIRELRAVDNGTAAVEVDRGLELYMDVLPSQGNQTPQLSRVPLHFLMASDALPWGDETFKRNCEDILRNCMGQSDGFGDSGSCDQIKVTSLMQPALETYINYNTVSTEPHTVIAMVDEFWVQTPRSYLGLGLHDKERKQFLDLDRGFTKLLEERKDKDVLAKNMLINSKPIDKTSQFLVPFTWNFGILLLRRNAWKSLGESIVAADETNPTSPKIPESIKKVISTINEKINSVDTYLSEPFPEIEKLKTIQENSELHWHDFLAACQFVSNEYAVRYDKEQLSAYELDLTVPESLLSLILEIWLSTFVWVRKCTKSGDAPKASQEDICLEALNALNVNSIAHIIDQGISWLRSAIDKRVDINQSHEQAGLLTLALYFTISVLAESIDFTNWELDEESFVFSPKKPIGNAIAGRYWYTTACSTMRAKNGEGRQGYDPDDPLLPFALPGYFSVRGDWHLAVLSSSRSRYLGEQAIAELSRYKAATVRLQTGVGLPVMKMVHESQKGQADSRVRTALPSPKGGRLATFSYEYLQVIAPIAGRNESSHRGHTTYFPIFRSQIKDYLNEHTLFLKGMCRLLTKHEEIQRRRQWDWVKFHDVMSKFEKEAKKYQNSKSDEDRTVQAAVYRGLRSSFNGIRIVEFDSFLEFTGYLQAFLPLSDPQANPEYK